MVVLLNYFTYNVKMCYTLMHKLALTILFTIFKRKLEGTFPWDAKQSLSHPTPKCPLLLLKCFLAAMQS